MAQPLTDTIDLFTATKKTEGLSRKTTDWYDWILRQFAALLDNPSLSSLTLDDARHFVAYLQDRDERYVDHPKIPRKAGGLSPYTISGYVRTIKVFGKWLSDEGLTKVNLFTKLRRPKLPETIIEVLTDDEIYKLQDAINPKTVIGARVQAIFLLMLDTGIRASELCTLRLDRLDVANGSAKVVGKGNKERVVFFANGAKKALTSYLHTGRPETTCPYVFTNDEGNALTYNALKLIFMRLGKHAGVTRLHPHLLRHTFAVRYLVQSKGDLIGLQRKLGHCDISTTTLYLHMSEQFDKAQAETYSPVDKLGLGNTRKNGRTAAKAR
jgi:site-specific recombinase XerD